MTRWILHLHVERITEKDRRALFCLLDLRCLACTACTVRKSGIGLNSVCSTLFWYILDLKGGKEGVGSSTRGDKAGIDERYVDLK